MDVVLVRTQLLLLHGAADAHSSAALEENPRCSVCGTPEPACELGECYWPERCPLEGRPS